MSLYQRFQNNKSKNIFKWTHYFPIYEKHFSSWKNKTLTFIEIGVYKGGSLQMWRDYFGPYATIIGIDIVPEVKNLETVYNDSNIKIRIGDQSDTAFLENVVQEFGPPDIVLDDGSHKMRDVSNSFNYLYSRLSKNGVYMIEDMHTAYWKEYGGAREDTFINTSKANVDYLNAHHSRGAIQPNFVTDNTQCISFYDSVVVYERGNITRSSILK